MGPCCERGPSRSGTSVASADRSGRSGTGGPRPPHHGPPRRCSSLPAQRPSDHSRLNRFPFLRRIRAAGANTMRMVQGWQAPPADLAAGIGRRQRKYPSSVCSTLMATFSFRPSFGRGHRTTVVVFPSFLPLFPFLVSPSAPPHRGDDVCNGLPGPGVPVRSVRESHRGHNMR